MTDVKVTREHRQIVADKFPAAQPGLFNMWLETGSSVGIPGNFEELARAIAEAEARGAAAHAGERALLAVLDELRPLLTYNGRTAAALDCVRAKYAPH